MTDPKTINLQTINFCSFSDRIFSRILIIPFKEIGIEHLSLTERMKVKEDLDQKMAAAIKSCGIIMQLYSIYDGMLDDPLAATIIPRHMDMRSQENYFLLIFTVCKVLVETKYSIGLSVYYNLSVFRP